jgi:hypothetical protein
MRSYRFSPAEYAILRLLFRLCRKLSADLSDASIVPYGGFLGAADSKITAFYSTAWCHAAHKNRARRIAPKRSLKYCISFIDFPPRMKENRNCRVLEPEKTRVFRAVLPCFVRRNQTAIPARGIQPPAEVFIHRRTLHWSPKYP